MNFAAIKYALFIFITYLAFIPTEAKNYSGLYFDKQSQQYFINNKATFSIKAVEDSKYLDEIQVSIDNNAYQKYQGKISFKNEGFHLVRFKAVDPVLNWSPVESFRIYVDLTAPTTHSAWTGSTHAKDGKFYINDKTKLILTAYDNLSGVSKTLWKNSGPAAKVKVKRYENSMHFKKSGLHTLELASVDNVGNREKWQKIVFSVDNKSPLSKALVKGNSYRKGAKLFIDKGSFISLDAKDSESGIQKVEYSLNGEAAKTYVEKISVEKKVTSLKYRAIDNVGNIEKWKEITVYLDATPPLIEAKNKGVFKKIAGKYYARPGFQVNVSVKDNESGALNIVVNNKAPEKSGVNKLFKFDKEGVFDFSVRGEDKVGNISNTLFYNIVIDKNPPNSSLSSTKKMVKRGDINMSSLPNKISISSIDSGVGVNHIEATYDRNKKEIFKIKESIDLATWKTPKRTIFYRAVDQLGNVEPWKSMRIHVRNRGPKVDLFVESKNLPEVPLSKLNKMYSKKLKQDPQRELSSTTKVKKKVKKKKLKRRTKKKKANKR